MFLFTPYESEEEEEEDKRENSASIGSRIDELEETLERKVRADSTTSKFMQCIGAVLKALLRWIIQVRNKEHSD